MRVFLVGSLLFVAASCVASTLPVEPAASSADRPDAHVESIATSPPATTSPPDERAPFSVGDRVSCNWKSSGTFYDGKVAELRVGGRVFIHYDDGDTEETSPGLCRIAGGGPVAAGSFRAGDRVSCNWRSAGRFYDGRVGELRALGRLFIQYDDGDSEETTPELCRSLGGSSAPSASFRVGDRVSCNWLGKGAFYEGVIAQLRGRGRLFIHYDDGDTEETSFSMCRPANGATTTLPAKKFRAGERVSCNWQGGGTFYEGSVKQVRASNRLFIQYDDGDQEETSAGMCKASSSAAVTTPVGTFKKGERVSCNWQGGGTFYDGKVAELRAFGRLFIQYDDGDTEETSPNLCRSLGRTGKPSGPLRAGDRVACNWLTQGTFYSGRVAEVRAGGKLFIQYDDGDQEETKANLCRRL